jgi:hypothetical protein
MPVRYAIITSLALLAAPALAHIAEPRPGESITVIAPRLDAEKTAEAARTYADRVLPTPPLYGQFARWRAPVCIQVSGVDPVYAPRIEGRIEAVAKAAEIPVAEAGCKPNLLVVFTPDARKTVEVIVTRKPRTLRRLAAEERRAVEEGALPVRWWYVIEQTDRNGVPASPMSTAVASAPTAMGGKSLIDLIPMNSDTVMTDNYMGGSLIDTNLIASVTGAVAVVDVPLATGVSLDALSEYLALVTLAPTRLPPTSPGVPSILDLFRPDVAIAPEKLSRWDSAFIAGLYQSADSRRASWQRGQIVEHVKASMEP